MKSNERMIRIIITGSNSTLDNGEAAILVSAIESLSEHIRNICFIVGSTHEEVDRRRYNLMLPSYDIKVITGIRIKTFFVVRAFFLLLRYIFEYTKSDVGLDVSGDGFGDYGPYGVFSSLSHAFQLLLGLIFRKPVVVYAQSIGPFKTRLTEFLARFTLSRVSLVTIREEITRTYIKRIGVVNPAMYLTADSAFLLRPAPSEKVNDILTKEGISLSNPLIGVSVSQLIHRWAWKFSNNIQQRYEKYCEIMAKVIDNLLEKTGGTVIIVCQTVGAEARHDDRIAAKSVYIQVKCKEKVKVLDGEFTPAELKGVIGRCDMFIGAKMHSTIASTSMCVPTVSVAYGHKVHGIIGRMLGQDNVIIDVRRLNAEEFFCELLSKVEYVWLNRGKISEELNENMKVVRERALMNPKLTATLLEYQKKGKEYTPSKLGMFSPEPDTYCGRT